MNIQFPVPWIDIAPCLQQTKQGLQIINKPRADQQPNPLTHSNCKKTETQNGYEIGENYK